jgi:hypothetical protein
MGELIATIADPDGNFFQFITPWEDHEKKIKNSINYLKVTSILSI